MPSADRLRVLGVSLADVSDWRDPQPSGKWSQFFSALAQQCELVDVVRPARSRLEPYLNAARRLHPRGAAVMGSLRFNRARATRRTQAVQRGLRDHAGAYDLVMQLQTMCAPGTDRRGAPYAIYTDSTMALTHRLYPPRAPLAPDAAEWWLAFEAEVCRGAGAVFTYSEFARASVIDDYGCSPERVLAVGAGANQMLDSLDEREPAAPRALFIGIDFTCKGGPTLLEAWPRVRERIPDAELVIAGPKRPPEGALPAGIRWMGRVERAVVSELYRGASVFVMPSLFEAWGHVFLEAMGYGLPCIGTTCCAMPEIIDHGVTGLLVPRGEAEPLADALVQLLGDPTRAAAMGRAAFASMQHGKRWSDVAHRVVAHLGARPLAPAAR